ncbi:hypothetical protein AAFC00_000896 [Neodothiora populina]|uniref:Mitochondrial large ribosomal subunit n=1 Tax=Neodothiora populina TaxID=2781224 RepID=A0ABR3PM42_9PEZI
MSVRTPSRRLLQSSALQCLHHPQPATANLPFQARRTAFNWFGRGKKENTAAHTNPILDEYMKRKPEKSQPSIIRGDLASSSIFDADRRIQEREEEKAAAAEQQASTTEETQAGGVPRNPATMAAVLDPNPAARERWQRKMVIREVRKGGRLNEPLFIKRTERELASRSHNFKTSTKKLGMLARQIAGKTIDDAIVQMRFSKKKAAQDILQYLEFTRDEAIVKRGMGLGAVEASTAAPEAAEAKPIDIQLKDGKRHTVTDKSKIYIDQAWVGRGPYGKAPDYRAKGRVNIMQTPWTSLSVVLKEEATRVREYEQREEKRRRQREKKVWHPLPDRPIVGQRQWFSW